MPHRRAESGYERPLLCRRQRVDLLHRRCAEMEEAQDRATRRRHGEGDADRDDSNRNREHGRPEPAPPLQALVHVRPHVRRRRKLELVPERDECAFELSHTAPSGARARARARLDRSLRHAERLRDLVLREPERSSAASRPCAGPPAAPSPRRATCPAARPRAGTPRGTGPRPPRAPRSPHAARDPRDGRPTAVGWSLVGDDAQQPRPKGRAFAETSERTPGLDEPVLRRVLRVARVACDHVGGPEGDALVCVHKLLVGVCVTALRAPDQLRFVEWSAHHRPFYTAPRYEVPTRMTPSHGKSSTWARPPLTVV